MKTQKYINRVINYVLDDELIDDYALTDVEYGGHSKNSLKNRSDLVYIKKDNNAMIDVELNRVRSKISLNRNRVYLHRLASDFYTRLNKEKPYVDDINIKQININNYNCEYEESINVLIRKEISYDIENNIFDNSTIKYFLYLPVARKMWYDGNRDEKISDLALLTCKSYEEMEMIAGSDKEREAMIMDLKNLSKTYPVLSEIEIQQYEEALRGNDIQEAKSKAIEEGIKEGHAKGHAEELI